MANIKYETCIKIEGIGIFQKVGKEGILTKYIGIDNEWEFYTFSQDGDLMTQMLESLLNENNLNIVFASSELKEKLEELSKN